MRFSSVRIKNLLAGVMVLSVVGSVPLRGQSPDPPTNTADSRVQDSMEVTKLLSEAKWRAALADYDAQTLLNYTYDGLSWESHAAQLRIIADHVNALGSVVNQLNTAKPHAATWQQVAIDRITPLLNALATNLNGTIDQLRNHPSQIKTGDYREYVQTNAELASRTSTTISEFVEYSRDSQRSEALQRRLELPPK